MSTTYRCAHITGIGVITPIGLGVRQFSNALNQGVTNYSSLSLSQADQTLSYPLAAVSNFDYKTALETLDLEEGLLRKAKRLRNMSLSSSYAVFCALQAWADAQLYDHNLDMSRVAIVSGGSNAQQHDLQNVRDKYQDKVKFMNPHYAINFMDTDVVGIVSELLAIKGEGFTIGAASASSNMAIIQGQRLVAQEDYDIVLVLAPLMNLSIFEYQAFSSLGAMAAIDSAPVNEICRPFDTGHRGFVHGQNAGCMVLESPKHAEKRAKKGYASIAGYGLNLDANRNPNPSLTGETEAMKTAINKAGINAGQINYVNTHGTASVIGDETEVQAIIDAGMAGVKANSTKSLIGHGLSAAGVVEAIATAIQVSEGFLHPGFNLSDPISNEIDWVTEASEQVKIDYAISNGFGFGGINTSIILKNLN